ncbi:MAG: sel1 repeat family protein [Rhodoferax sp.]|nr:sel1 repeat family protein [Rhodoferax sp.]
MKNLLLLLLCAFACIGTSAQTSPYGEADAANARNDYVNALRIFRALAQEGDAIAQFNLGVMLDFGQGTAPDQAQAITWYRRAAAQGHGAAQFNLGGMYLEGLGVAKDPVRAYMWFTLGAIAGVAGAAKNRSSVARLLTPAQAAQAQQMARDCQQREFRACD